MYFVSYFACINISDDSFCKSMRFSLCKYFSYFTNFRLALDLYLAILYYVYKAINALRPTITLTLPLQMEFNMSRHSATVQICFEKAATIYDAALTITDLIYWIDETYVQPFYAWAAPRLQDAALSDLCWALIALFETALWLIDTTQRFMDIDARAIAYCSFAQKHDPLLETLALCLASVPLALPATVTQSLTVLPFFTEEFWAVTVDVTPEITLVEFDVPGPIPLALCPAIVPLSMHSAFDPADPGYALLNTILDSGFFSFNTIRQDQPSIDQDPQPTALKQPKSKLGAPASKVPAKTPNKTSKAKKNRTVAEAPVTPQDVPRKRSQRNGANTTQ
jgi:hypothetical protein